MYILVDALEKLFAIKKKTLLYFKSVLYVQDMSEKATYFSAPFFGKYSRSFILRSQNVRYIVL